MDHLTDEILTMAIEAMEDDFESHDVIQWIMRNAQISYIEELYDKRHGQDPIRYVHSLIGRAIGETGLVEKKKRTISGNARLEDTDNQGWRRL